MDERVRFVARLLDGEKMAVVCEAFGISRKTGYKIYQRYKDIGTRGLSDRSRRPHRQANQLPMAVEKAIVRLKKDYPSWGAPKIRERLKQKVAGRGVSGNQHSPCGAGPARTSETPAAAGAPAADRHHLVAAADAQRALVCGLQRRVPALESSLLLSADDHRLRSRYLLACEALSTTQERYAFGVFERAFQDCGLPHAIRTDNGVPFASAHASMG